MTETKDIGQALFDYFQKEIMPLIAPLSSWGTILLQDRQSIKNTEQQQFIQTLNRRIQELDNRAATLPNLLLTEHLDYEVFGFFLYKIKIPIASIKGYTGLLHGERVGSLTSQQKILVGQIHQNIIQVYSQLWELQKLHETLSRDT